MAVLLLDYLCFQTRSIGTSAKKKKEKKEENDGPEYGSQHTLTGAPFGQFVIVADKLFAKPRMPRAQLPDGAREPSESAAPANGFSTISRSS